MTDAPLYSAVLGASNSTYMVNDGFDQRGAVNIEIAHKAFSGSKGTLVALKDILLTINPGEKQNDDDL